MTLTQEGELFLPMARQLLADWDNVEEAMRQSFTLQRGKFPVAAMPSFAGQRPAGGAEGLSRPLCRRERHGA
ncbi:LysR family transcriptional regulator [Klebsiella variicola]|nr:LysR family transcriptional regulator [Klebsiella variicola]